MNTALIIASFFPVWIPVLVAIFARRIPIGIRIVLGLSGISAGVYARSIWTQIPHAGGHERGWAFLLVPFTTAALSFYLAYTGICLLAVLHYVAKGRAVCAPSILAFLLFATSLVLGAFYVIPLLSWPIR